MSWNTIQGTPQQLQTAAQMKQATEVSIVVVTHHHGLVDDAIAACRRVKLAKPACSCILHLDVQLVVNDSAVGGALNRHNGLHKAWLLRDDAGQLMLPAGKFLTPDYGIEGSSAAAPTLPAAGSWTGATLVRIFCVFATRCELRCHHAGELHRGISRSLAGAAAQCPR